MPPLPWTDPLECAAGLEAQGAFGDADWVLLYSGVRTSYSGRYSYLAFDPQETMRGDALAAFAEKLSADQGRFDNFWLGYLGYGLERPPEASGEFHLPGLTMTRFGSVIEFDHDTRGVRAVYGIYPVPVYASKPPALPKAGAITSNMSKTQYLDKAASIIRRTHEGDLYQANLTRKFNGSFESEPHAFSVFRSLCAASPAAYSAFLKLGDTAILSSSPELFVRINAEGRMETRPIKGSMPRFADPTQDAQSRQTLADSAKDRAENLMIVDLMRNDFSRSCIPGSVLVPSLFDITSHATIHHMSSTVTGLKSPGCSSLQAVAHCFPPGSMTGAPKIRAMQLCAETEGVERGIYSGAIGWFGGDGACELSVVIRTLILRGKRFEFQVGGGIVADSAPDREWMETIDKAKGILLALGLSPTDLQF